MTSDNNAHQTKPGWRAGVWEPLSLVAVILCLSAAHLNLLHVPYFWDETYFAAAARDLYLTGRLLPTSVPLESHPPLVYAWLAIWWKLFGFSIVVARSAMLTIAVLTLVGVYQLARLVTTGVIPIVVTALTGIYAVFFGGSTMVQLDMAAAGLTIWALVAYLRGRLWTSSVLFGLAALAKETAIVAPLMILGLETLLSIRDRTQIGHRIGKAIIPLVLPSLLLVCWFGWLYHATGHTFGDPDYVRYNTEGTIHPLRIVLACLQHLWHLLVYLNLFVVTGIAAIVCVRHRRATAAIASSERTHIWLTLAAVTAGYVVMLSMIGAVTLARYLLPVYPFVMLASIAAISARVKWWPVIAAVTAVAFVAGLFPYTNRLLFRRDDNLAYIDYVTLHQDAFRYFAHDNKMKVMTVWPAADELKRPWLGYTEQAMKVFVIQSFTPEELTAAARENRPDFILMFPRRVCKVENPLLHASWWHSDHFRAVKELTPEEIASLLNARVIYSAQRNCDSISVLKLEDEQAATYVKADR